MNTFGHKKRVTSAIYTRPILFLVLLAMASPCWANEHTQKARSFLNRTNTAQLIQEGLAKIDSQLFLQCKSILTWEAGKQHPSVAELREVERALSRIQIDHTGILSQFDTFVLGSLEAVRELLKSCESPEIQRAQSGGAICRQPEPPSPGNSKPLSGQIRTILRNSDKDNIPPGYSIYAERIPGVGGVGQGVRSGTAATLPFSPGDPTSDPYLPLGATPTDPGAFLKKSVDYDYAPPALIGNKQIFPDLIYDIPMGKGPDERLEDAAKSPNLPAFFKSVGRANRIFLAKGGMNHVHMIYPEPSTLKLTDLKKEYHFQTAEFAELDPRQPHGSVTVTPGSNEEDLYKFYFKKAPPVDMATEEMVAAIDFHRRGVKGGYVAKLRKLAESGNEDTSEVLAQFRRDLVIQELLTELSKSFHPKGEDPAHPLIEVVPILYNQDTMAQGIIYQKAVRGTKVSDLYQIVAKAKNGSREAEADLKAIGFQSTEEAKKKLRLLEAFYRETHNDILNYSKAKGIALLRNGVAGEGLVYADIGGDFNHGQNVIWDGVNFKIIDF